MEKRRFGRRLKKIFQKSALPRLTLPLLYGKLQAFQMERKPEPYPDNMKTAPNIASTLSRAAMVAAMMREPAQTTTAPALFITNPNAAELARLRAENAALRAAIPAALPPRQIGEYRKSERTAAEREANVAKVLKTERDSNGVKVHNSLRKLITWRTPARRMFTKPTENIWTA